MFCVYVLLCANGSLYVGQTQNLTARLHEHLSGRVQSTKRRLPLTVILTEHYVTRAEAMHRERYLKSGYGRKWLGRRAPRGRPAPDSPAR